MLLLLLLFYVVIQVVAVNPDCVTNATNNYGCDSRCNGYCSIASLSKANQGCCVDSATSTTPGCASGYYLWTADTSQSSLIRTCSSYCPAGYFSDQFKVCHACDTQCQTCKKNAGGDFSTNTDCLSCAVDAYQLNSTSCWLINTVTGTTGYTSKWNPCPDQAAVGSGTVGYYGYPLEMKCYACPTGCKQCHIFLTNQLRNPATYVSPGYLMTQECVGQPKCQYTLKCYSCSSGYALVQGFCVTTARCRRYSEYNSTALGGFNSNYCSCMSNFYLTGLTFCSPCHYSCLTCSGASASSCTKCQTGRTLSGSTCNYNSTMTGNQVQNWITFGILNQQKGTWTATDISAVTSGINQGNCTSANYVFGYAGYDQTTNNNRFPSAVLSYSTNGGINLGTDHYAIHLRATILFIDEWNSQVSLVVREGGFDRFSFYYRMENILGQYYCGRNYHDHHDVLDNHFPHQTSSIVNLNIQASQTGFAWGIKQLVLSVMKCHSSCLTCDGPTQKDCLTCYSARHQVIQNGQSRGDCRCDIANDYYDNAGTCVVNCTGTTLFMDYQSQSCVSTCSSFPYLYKYTDPADSTKKSCVQHCPTGYKYQGTTWQCKEDCFTAGVATNLNYYNWNGIDKICFNICPNGTFGDPDSHNCVPLCPKTSTTNSQGYFALGSWCYQNCDSNTWAFPADSRKCVSQCPHGYYQNTKVISSVTWQLCQDQCSVTLGGQYLYGDNSTGTCVDVCPDKSYADEASHMCLDICNDTAYRQSIVNSGGVTIRTCVQRCDSAGNGLYGNYETGYCVLPANCPINSYGDSHTTFCQIVCSDSNQFGDNDTRTCQTTCTNGFKSDQNKVCVKTCPVNNSAGNPQYGDGIVSGECVQTCPNDPVSGKNTFADNQTNRQCKFTCAGPPTYSDTFGQDFICVMNCSSHTWADPFDTNRICTTSCTYQTAAGGIKSYGYNKTRRCVEVCPDTEFGTLAPDANGTDISICVSGCLSSTFGNPVNNLCETECPPPYYGDPTGLRLCLKQCPIVGGVQYFSLNVSDNAMTISTTRICVTGCTYGWADNYTRSCAIASTGCTSGLFAHETNHKCVIAAQCTGFGDPVSRHCIDPCYQNVTQNVKYFGDDSTSMCVLICPQDPDSYGDNYTNQCQTTCTNTSQFRDPQYMRRCVAICSRTPVALFGDRTDKTCVTAKNCTSGTYGDNFTLQCQSDCKGTVLQYADPVSNECVSQCQLGYYALNVSANVGKCSRTCPVPLWADNLTVECEPQCSSLTYGVNYTDPSDATKQIGICQTQCPLGQFARDVDNLCVSNCGVDHWGQTVSRRCLTDPQDCPQGYYADNKTHMCVVSTGCSINNGIQYVADNITKYCVSGCPALFSVNSTFINYADMAKFLCVAVCPYNKFGDNNTLKCVDQCKNAAGAYTGQFADPQLRICVQICSAAPISTFGENDTYTCVQAKYCPAETWAQVDVYNRQCRPTCPSPNMKNSNPRMYADNMTKKCVQTCPTYFYGDLSKGYGMCVDVCPTIGGNLQFSSNLTKTCVEVCPSSTKYWGDVVSLRCVLVCPSGYYAQQVPKRYCVTHCSLGTWGQDIKRTCVTSPANCPTVNGSHFYADNSTTMCVKKCSLTQNLWGQNSTWQCLPNCLTGFKWNLTRVCIDLCPAQLDTDGYYSDFGAENWMCYSVCVRPLYYRDPQKNRSCVTGCSFSPLVYYADDITMKCVLTCPKVPKYYYSYDANHTCMLTCPLSTMKDSTTQKCVNTCPTGAFFDSNSDQCVAKCPSDYSTGVIYFGDPTKTIPQCVANSSCPTNYYADSNIQKCVQTCSQSQWKYLKNCVTYCPDGYYGNYDTGFCVIPSGCPTNFYANNQTKTCVSVCNGSFADTNAKKCVNICPTSYYADPATRLCSLSCTNNSTISLHKNLANQTCVASCDQLLYLNPNNNKCQSSCADPLYADPTTQMCVSVCPSTPQLYGQNDTNYCVEECSNLTNQYKFVANRVCVTSCPSGYYRDNFTRFCVQECLNITYADDTSKYCVYNCTPNYSLDDPNICTSSCPLPYYKDSTTYKCVLSCPTYPQQYYKVVTATDRRCDLNCPTGQYRDKFSFSCVQLCPPSPPTYSDSSSGNCVTICPSSPSYYAYNDTRTCLPKCPSGMFTQNNTRTCVFQCPDGTSTYADNTLAIPSCVFLCSSGTFGDPYTKKCVAKCQDYPKMYGYDDGSTRICLQSCPYPYVADNTTQQCQLQCNNQTIPYLDKASKQCVSVCTSSVYLFSYMPTGQTTNGECVKFCPTGRFALLTNNSCVPRCPEGLYGDIQNNTCYENCTYANDRYADPTTNLCVETCPNNDTYDMYADLFSRTCVSDCPTDKNTFADQNTRHCQPRCTVDTEYADPTSGKCVTICPSTPTMLFADPFTQTCVEQCDIYTLRYKYIGNQTCVTDCPVITPKLYADDASRTCVIAEECPEGYWGLNSSRVCVDVCPTTPNLFGDIQTKTCVSDCPDTYYADFTTRQCVKVCPSIPALFAENTSKTCVSQCPDKSYADNYTRRCVKNCSKIPVQTYADNSTNRCVIQCPIDPNYFASNSTYECVKLCPSSPDMFADYSTRKCVQDCPGGDIDTYADSSIRFCVKTCPGTTFMQNSTRRCVSKCLTGFADPKSKFCIDVCPAYTYGFTGNKTCLTSCPDASPKLYAQDGNNMCMTSCLSTYGTYAHDTSKRCVKICPISQNLFAENTNRKCVPICPNGQFADFSTRYCVGTCPMIPALYGINSSKVCTDVCPANTWSDNSTRRCVSICPSVPDTYGENSTWACVYMCPTKPMTYADYSTRLCVPTCPKQPYDLYADNATQSCVLNCTLGTYADPTTQKCVQTCPLTYFGYNQTHRCITNCVSGEFADHLLHLCVEKCSVDPIYYGNPDTHNCVQTCPAANHSFGNPLTQQCVKYLSNGFSGCPNAYFADNQTRLCVQVCPMKKDTYGDNSTWKCVSTCPAGTQNTFADNSTMRCVKVCPEYPQMYAQEYSRRCVKLCLPATSTYSGSFADNSTRLCVQKCPSIPNYYSDNSTRRCVFYCPRDPLTFADDSTRRCVTQCPSDPDYYGDLSTLICVHVCPQIEQTYADNSTRLCVKVCPSSPQSLYGQNYTNVCVKDCPSGSFADNSSRLCVAVCPQFPDTYGDPSTNRCVSQCPPVPDLYADPLSQQCVLRCPDGYYAENNSRRCLPECPHGQISFADNVTNRCVKKCPEQTSTYAGTYGDNSTNKCVFKCPKVPQTYADNITRMCLKICLNETNGGYGDNYTLICVSHCPDDSYGDITTRYCTRYCPDGWFAYNETNMCVKVCLAPYFGDNSTWTCVKKCPVSQLLFGQNLNRTCIDVCPQGLYSDEFTQQCVQYCPPEQDTFAFEPNNTCLKQCPIPYYGYPGYPYDYKCVTQCPNPYYENITDHRCYKCPDQCSQCNYPQLCITCIADHFLYAGSCVESCPTFPIITYANPKGQCGTSLQCTSGYFALNTTKTCVTTCPAGFFKNNTQQTCDACMRGCTNCRNSSACITCNTTLGIWDNFVCHTFCSPLRRYYSPTGCVSICPTGYYLNLTTCSACSSLCKKCEITPQNCLTCADGLYIYNNLCVQTCPQNMRPSVEGQLFSCKSCDQIDCTQKQLKYEVTQVIENYQYKMRVKFNQNVNITKQIDKVFKIVQKTSRRLQQMPITQELNTQQRLLQTTSSNINYTLVDYGNGEFEIILTGITASPDSNLQFQLQIIDPQSVVSQSGQYPTQTRSQITFDKNQYYPPSAMNQSYSSYIAFLTYTVFVLLFLTFWTQHKIWTPIIDLFQMLYVLFFINISMPPSLSFSLATFQNSLFSFLPNMFSSAMPYPTFNSGINNAIYSSLEDTLFLRHIGYIFTILIILVPIILLIFVLSKKMPAFMKQYGLKKMAKKFIRQTFWKKHLVGLLNILCIPILLFTFIGIRQYSASDYENISQPIVGFSIFCSWVFTLVLIIAFLVFTIQLLKFIRNYQLSYFSLRKSYNYILRQQVILLNNPIYNYIIETKNIDLTNLATPRINQSLILPYPLQTNIGYLTIGLPLFQFLFKLVICLAVCIGFQSPVVQLFLLILANSVFLVYYCVAKPYYRIDSSSSFVNQQDDKQESDLRSILPCNTKNLTLNNLFKLLKSTNTNVIINHFFFGVICVTLLAYVFIFQNSTLDERLTFATVILILIITVCTYSFLVFLLNIKQWYYQNAWRKFITTELFKTNYINEYLEYEEYFDKVDRRMMKLAGDREQFLEHAKVQQENGFEQIASSAFKSKQHAIKGVNLRPSHNKALKQQVDKIFKNIANQHERSHKSVVSSERLSKKDRQKARKEIFKELEPQIVIKKPEYDGFMQYKKLNNDTVMQQIDRQDEEETEYEYEYIEEQYPQGVQMDQITKGCKKGDIVMP